MIRKTIEYFRSIPAVAIDGILYVGIGMFIFSQGYLGTDEAAKFIAPLPLFWLNYLVGLGATAFGALKMFRSNSYSNHQKLKKEGNTEFLKKEDVKT